MCQDRKRFATIRERAAPLSEDERQAAAVDLERIGRGRIPLGAEQRLKGIARLLSAGVSEFGLAGDIDHDRGEADLGQHPVRRCSGANRGLRQQLRVRAAADDPLTIEEDVNAVLKAVLEASNECFLLGLHLLEFA
jgi:hypothetical protein